jgi:hypothetical protein
VAQAATPSSLHRAALLQCAGADTVDVFGDVRGNAFVTGQSSHPLYFAYFG